MGELKPWEIASENSWPLSSAHARKTEDEKNWIDTYLKKIGFNKQQQQQISSKTKVIKPIKPKTKACHVALKRLNSDQNQNFEKEIVYEALKIPDEVNEVVNETNDVCEILPKHEER